MRRQGVVTAIDRANKVVRATIDEIPEIECTYYSGRREPWPLCHAWFSTSNGSVWHCDGPIGSRRLLFHDDFMHVVGGSASLGVNASVSGDTPWQLRGPVSGASTTASVAAVAGAGVGAVRYEQNDGPGTRLRKDVGSIAIREAPYALHLTWRFRAETSDLATWRFQTGFTALTVNEPTARFTLVVTSLDEGSTFTTVEGTTHVPGDWYTCDLISTKPFGAAWVDGNGPTLTARGDPQDLSPSENVEIESSATGSVAELDLDYITASVVQVAGDVL